MPAGNNSGPVGRQHNHQAFNVMPDIQLVGQAHATVQLDSAMDRCASLPVSAEEVLPVSRADLEDLFDRYREARDGVTIDLDA